MSEQRTLLDEALARGIISENQRKQLADIGNEERHDNEERIKPVGTLNEIFVTFGVILLVNAVNGLMALVLKNALAVGMASVGVAWAVALFFNRSKRFRLPIIYCGLSAAITIGTVLFGYLLGDQYSNFEDAPLYVSLASLGAAMLVLAGAAARFRIPFFMLPISILFTIMVTMAAQHGAHDAPLRLLLGACGLAILAVAVHFDLRDPQRITRWSDFAFWSYVVGSPLFVHSVFLTLIIGGVEQREWMGPFTFMLMAAATIAVSFAALLLNRRALILSTLIYVAIIIFRLLTVFSTGFAPSMILFTILLIGLYVTALGSRWAWVRHYVLSRQPKSWTWMKRLPPY